MKNFHQNTILLNRDKISRIDMALDVAWSKETADPESQDKWTESNKALGQCAITSVLIYDLFGGRMIYDKTNFHIWNELPDGSQHDFTRSQFDGGKNFSVYKYKTREDVLYDERGQKTHIIDRYNQLKQKFLNIYSVENK